MTEEAKSELVAKWCYEIDQYERRMQKWEKRGDKILKRYKDERPGVSEQRDSRFNSLWSNIQTLMPALYAKLPKPEIERRYRDADKVGRQASELLQRAASYGLSCEGMHATFKQAIFDYLLVGRGQLWMRYVPTFAPVQIEDGDEVSGGDDEPDNDADDVEPLQEVTYEEVAIDYVHWKDFGHTEARTWQEVGAVWRQAFLGRKELVARFGEEIGNAIPLNAYDKEKKESEQKEKKARIYEIWDKNSRNAIWICKDFPRELDVREDPLKLKHFFPCPKPLFATLTNDSLEPVPDYVLYQDQATQLDELTGRIASLTKAVKVVGVYDASQQGLQRILNEGIENAMIPVESWAAFGEKGGLAGTIDFLPIKEVVEAIVALYQAREHVKNDMYEITGLSDILRGDTDASETATAQQLKGNFAGMRFGDRRSEVQSFLRDAIQIMVEIISEHFSPETLKTMSGLEMFMSAQEKKMAQMQMQPRPPVPGMQPPPALPQPDEKTAEMLENPTWEEVIGLIRNDALRSFRIDIETDSTIASDEKQEKQDRLDFLEKTGGFLEKMIPAAQGNPTIAPLLMQMLMFGIRSFRVGRQMEGEFESAIEKLTKQAQQPQEPKPDPDVMKIQAQSQAKQQEMQMSMQLEQQRMQMENQRHQAQLQADAQAEQIKQQLQAQQVQHQNELEAQRMQLEQQSQNAIETMKAQFSQQLEAMKTQAQIAMNRENNAVKLEVAEIAAQTTLDAAQVSAAKQGAE